MSWQAASAAVVTTAALGGMLWYERRRPPAKLVAMVAALAALAVAARVLFAGIPNVQGTTDVALLSGYVLGPAPGFMVGALAALASNLFLGQGPWTPWQMVGWGAAGLGGALLAAVAGHRLGRWPLALVCALAGLAFGAWMDLFTLTSFAAQTSADGYVAIAVLSLPFNIAHALGNAALCLVFGPAFVRVVERFRRRLDVTWSPRRRDARASAALIACVACIAAGALLTAAPSALAARGTVTDGVRYLERSQNVDGGFGGGPGQGSSQLVTGWTVLGLEAAGRHPLDVRRAGKTPIDFIRAGAGKLEETGELERTILALRGARIEARSFGGRDLLGDLLHKLRPDGSFSGLSNWTAFAIMSLRACGRSARAPVVRRAAAWLARQQNSDGGFSYATRGGGSFVDETGAALQGLAAAGRRRGRVVKRALSFLRKAQNADGGFGQSGGYRSNAQSTAWGVQGIVAVGSAPASFRRRARSPLAYLSSLQQDDGSFRYSRSSAQTPVWVTAQVIAALRRRAFPLRAPARRSARRPSKPRVASPARARRRLVRPKRFARVTPKRLAAARVRPARVSARPAAARAPAPPRRDDGPSEVLLIGGGALGLIAAGIGAFVLRSRRA